MKLLHTADWHLGRMLYGKSLLEDQEYFIRESFLPAVREHRPDLVILAGDIYDRPIAPAAAIRLFDEVIGELSALGIPLAAISGNHDGADRLAIGASLLRKSGIFIASRPEDVFQPAEFRFGGEKVCVYLLPYCEPAQIRQVLGDDSLQGFKSCYAALLGRVAEGLDLDAVNILAAHCFAAGGAVSDSESVLYVGGSGEVDPSCFDPFQYAALGHLHAPQRAGTKGYYAGSPLKYSFDEERQKKGMTLAEVTRDGVEITRLPVKPLRDMRRVRASMQELLDQGRAAPSEDYLSFELTDRAPVFLPMEQLRPYYPNLLELRNDWMGPAAGTGSAELRERLLRRTAGETAIFREFLRQICGEDATEEDCALFSELLREARGKEAGDP